MTDMRKIHEGVADLSQTYQLLQRHHDKPWDQRTAASYAGEFWETTEEAYWVFLEEMPPKQQEPDCFLMCEATTENIYSGFFNIHIDGESRYFHASVALEDRSSLTKAKYDIRDMVMAEPAPETGTTPSP